MHKNILVTGGAGFIGSSFVRHLIDQVDKLVVLDLLTYAGNLKNLEAVGENPKYTFIRGDILNAPLVEELVKTYQIDTIVHFAAESHVDRSIEDPRAFYRTNVEGTIQLLEVVRRYPHIHFHHVSTDEVYGSLEDGAFTETSPYRPNSPYAASKAASDHFVRAYAKTFGIKTTLSHSSNNFGPYQYTEKFIPRMLSNLLNRKQLPVYGEGTNIRDWLFVDDHARGIWEIVQKGELGQNYNIGGRFEMRNIDLLHLLIERFAKAQKKEKEEYTSLITFVKDRPGHDFRYALSCDKIENELGFRPEHSFEKALEKTIDWYLNDWK